MAAEEAGNGLRLKGVKELKYCTKGIKALQMNLKTVPNNVCTSGNLLENT